MRIRNPILWSDYPDPDLIRVGDTYYMVSTTMFFMPGGPILRSYDLKHWEIVSYIFENLEGYDRVGCGYGRGQWATSLRYHDGVFYAFFTCLDLGRSFLFRTRDPEKSGWERIDYPAPYHDASLLFDDDGTVYLIYNVGDVRLARFSPDFSALLDDAPLFSAPSEGMALRCEGCRALKKDGWYYLFFIDIPAGGIRRELCYRARDIRGPYEHRVVADSMSGCRNMGVAQGMPVDTPRGDWYIIMFGDTGSVGRIPFLYPMTWEEDWPVIGAGQGMRRDYETDMPEKGENVPVHSDSFDHRENRLALWWQWNHSPDNSAWSFTERPGWLRLHAAPAEGLMTAKNTLSQRTAGPVSVFTAELDASGLEPGGKAGLAALQYGCAMIGVEALSGGRFRVLTERRNAPRGFPGGGRPMAEPGPQFELDSAPLTGPKVFLRACFDFRDRADTVAFFWSPDGWSWNALGGPEQVNFDGRYFVGTRAALYCYGGGSADFRNFEASVQEYLQE